MGAKFETAQEGKQKNCERRCWAARTPPHMHDVGVNEVSAKWPHYTPIYGEREGHIPNLPLKTTFWTILLASKTARILGIMRESRWRQRRGNM